MQCVKMYFFLQFVAVKIQWQGIYKNKNNNNNKKTAKRKKGIESLATWERNEVLT